MRSSYKLTLTAFDGGVPSRSGSCDISVLVVDANDNRPTFDQSAYEANIPENIPPASTVLRVHATDPDDGDNGAVRYQLSAASLAHYGHVFSVDNSTGDVIVVGIVDYERTTVYHLVVCAVDSGSELVTSSDVVVVIKVDDVNDNAPRVIINTLTASGTDVASVAENSSPGTFVGHVIVSDLDSGRNGKTNCTLVAGPTDGVFRLEHLFETEYQVSQFVLEVSTVLLVTLKIWMFNQHYSNVKQE
jgi:Cadherin domain